MAILNHALLRKSRKCLLCDVNDTATHAELVYDVTDTDLQIQNVALKAVILRLSDVECYRNQTINRLKKTNF